MPGQRIRRKTFLASAGALAMGVLIPGSSHALAGKRSADAAALPLDGRFKADPRAVPANTAAAVVAQPFNH